MDPIDLSRRPFSPFCVSFAVALVELALDGNAVIYIYT